MTDCERTRALLPDALRGRLAPADRAAFDAHLQGCAPCRALFERERALDEQLRAAREAAPAELKERLIGLSKARKPAAKAVPLAARVPRRAAFAAAGALTAALAIGLFTLRAFAPDPTLVNEAINDHLRVIYAEHPLEVESGGIHQVKPWFTGRLDFAPAFAFSGDEEFPMQGGAVSYFVDRKAAAIVFKHRLHTITLLVFRADGLPWSVHGNTPLGPLRGEGASARGFNTLIWRKADLGYALVSDAEPATLARLGAKIVSEN